MLFDDYKALLKHTGAAIRHEKVGPLPSSLEPIAQRVGLNPECFVAAVRDYSRNFFSMVGQVHRIEVEGARLGKQRVKGIAAASRMYLKTG